ncbi:hypothetical protein MC81_20440 [Achromobacter insolitus]|nr:hypothetical protein MC81_20440 [Achromobacter insolitus]
MLSAVALLIGQTAIACRCLGNAVALQGCAGRFQEGLNFFFTGGVRRLKMGGNDTKFTFSGQILLLDDCRPSRISVYCLQSASILLILSL